MLCEAIGDTVKNLVWFFINWNMKFNVKQFHDKHPSKKVIYLKYIYFIWQFFSTAYTQNLY